MQKIELTRDHRFEQLQPKTKQVIADGTIESGSKITVHGTTTKLEIEKGILHGTFRVKVVSEDDPNFHPGTWKVRFTPRDWQDVDSAKCNGFEYFPDLDKATVTRVESEQDRWFKELA